MNTEPNDNNAASLLCISISIGGLELLESGEIGRGELIGLRRGIGGGGGDVAPDTPLDESPAPNGLAEGRRQLRRRRRRRR